MANLRVDKITSTETFETTGSVQFDGDDHLSIAASDDNDLGTTTDYTIEFWVYFSKNTSSSNQYVFDMDSNGTRGQLYQQDFYFYFTSSKFVSTPYTGTGEWVHIALCRSGGIGYGFKNGILIGTTPAAASAGNASAWRIGQYGGGSHGLDGHVSNFRILKGKALYTENFKPPMRELENIPGTSLLVCQSKTDASLEKTGKTITANGNAVASELTPGLLTPVPKAGAGSAITGSVEFNGNARSDYLEVSSSDFAFGTGDFTLEFWFYDASPTSGVRRWVTSTLGAFNSNTFIIRESNADITFRRGLSTVTYPKNNSWAHLAYTRDNGVEYLFYNGVLLASVSSTIDYTDTTLYIGGYYNSGNTEYFQGSFSNLRIVKGTALYTDDFIPPTRELKKVPGTVLLCCQDPNDPTTEATGKTITGHGNLDTDTTNENLITNGNFTTSASDGWTVVEGTGTTALGTAQSGTFNDGNHLVLTATSGTYVFLAQEFTTKIGSTYLVNLQSNGADESFISTSSSKDDAIITDIRNTGGNNKVGDQTFVATQTSYHMILRGGTGGGNFDTASVYKVLTPNGASNFTPQVGDDRQVTFEGVTKINTENYFYLPTSNTESREATGTYNAGTRGLFAAGNSPGIDNKAIDYITIATAGDALDFGDLSVNAALQEGGCASYVRGIFTGFITPGRTSNIEYVTISSTSNTNDFGDLTRSDSNPSALSNSTRGVFFGGAVLSPASYADIIDYVTISSTGNAQDFGDMITASYVGAGAASPTRGILAGGYNGSAINSIEYVTISSTGNAKDFGDLLNVTSSMAGASNAIRAVFAGGETPSVINTIQYLTISTTGNTFDFGDLPAARRSCGGASSSTRMVIAGGFESPTQTTQMEFVNIATTSNTFDFGDLVYARMNIGSLSNGHGGLG